MRAFTAIAALSTSVLLQFAPGFTTAEEAAAVQVSVTKLVSKDLLSGTDFTLQPKASIVSSRAVYTLKSPAGTDEVTGTVSLLERANEILELFVAAQVDLRILTLPAGLDPADFPPPGSCRNSTSDAAIGVPGAPVI